MGREPDVQPQVRGASRGKDDDPRHADKAGGGERAAASTEYTANAEPDEHPDNAEAGDDVPR